MSRSLDDTLRELTTSYGADVVPPPADRLRTRLRRRRATRLGGVAAVTAVGLVALVVSPGSSNRPQRLVTSPPATAAPGDFTAGSGPTDPLGGAYAGGRFTREIRLDGGALVVTPAPDDARPELFREQADLDFRSSDQVSQTGVRATVLALARVTVAPAVSAPDVVAFQDQLAWVAFFQIGPHSCPFIPASAAARVPEPDHYGWHAFVIAAASARGALLYAERGSSCGQAETGPIARETRQVVSVAWTEVSRNGRSLTVSLRVPPCAVEQGLMRSTDTGANTETITLLYRQSYASILCPLAPTVMKTIELASATIVPIHGPEGPFVRG